MKKRLLFLALMLVLLLSLLTITASAETYSGTCGGEGDGTNLVWSLDTATGELTISGKGKMRNYSYDYGHESVAPWYARRSYVKSIIIDEGVETIGKCAFYECDSLAYIDISESILAIGEQAFYECDSLASIGIPDNVTDIEEQTFFGCSSLVDVVIGKNVTTIGNYAFQGCTNLRDIGIPHNVIAINKGAFMGCAFTSLTIPDNVTYIGKSAFSYCPLTNATLPNGITTISGGMFSSCKALTKIIIPNGVTLIDDTAFSRCTSLREIVIPASLTAIEDEAFHSCDALTDVYYYGTETQWDSISMGTYTYPITNAERHYMETCYTFKANYEHMVQDACVDCGVTLGETVVEKCTDNDKNGLCDLCNGILSTIISGFCGELYVKNVIWELNIETGELTISGEGKVADYAYLSAWLDYIDFIDTVKICDGVTAIGEYAFHGNYSVKSVDISDTVIIIEDCAFLDCFYLTTLKLGNRLSTVGEAAFAFCEELSDIYYYGTPMQWSSIVVGTDNAAFENATWHYMTAAYTYNIDRTHTLSDICSDCGVTYGESVTYVCVDEDRNNLCDVCGGEQICTHTGKEGLVYTSNGDCLTHKVTLNCTVCKEVLEVVIDREDCTFSNGKCMECGGRELVRLTVAGSNMTLGNELVVNILVKQTDIVDEGLTAYLTHHAETGAVSYELPQAQWENYMSRYYKFSVPVAAAQMTDQVSIEIKDATGNVYNNAYSTSICDYVERVYATNADEVKTLMVDMLNYGAAAQEHFDYRTKTPANVGLTEAQQAMATADVTCADTRLKGSNYIGSNLSLEDQILLNFMFTGVSDDIRETMYATVEFTGVLGNKVRETVPVQKLMNKYAGVTVDQIVLADSVCPVTATLYNADGTVYGTVTDSVESYIARQNPNGTNALYNNIMKFAASALAYKQ